MLYTLLLDVLEKYTIDEIKDYLYVDKNTINRWKLLKKVPNYYYFDFCNLLNIDIDYENFSFSEKDQFFTHEKIVKKCLIILQNKLKEHNIDTNKYIFIEPSAGDGSFYKFLPEDKRIGIDIEPKFDGIIKGNYLEWKPTDLSKNYIVLGNPPFGLRGNLALRFMNHSAEFSDFVAFILPQLFDSNGKGTCMNRIKGLNLIHSEKIDSNFYYPDGTNININVIFQIWSKNIKIDNEKESCSDYIKIYSLSDGGTPGSTRNKKMLYDCDVYLPSTCFGIEKMKTYFNFEELPHRRGYGIKILQDNENVTKVFENINWSNESFKSTNSALNLRFSLIEEALIKNGLGLKFLRSSKNK